MMIKDKLDPKEFEPQSDQENIAGRITALNHMKPVPQVDPPGVPKLPK